MFWESSGITGLHEDDDALAILYTVHWNPQLTVKQKITLNRTNDILGTYESYLGTKPTPF